MRGYNVTPRVAPVCGGIDIIIEGIDHLSLKRQEKSTLLAIEGSRKGENLVSNSCGTRQNLLSGYKLLQLLSIPFPFILKFPWKDNGIYAQQFRIRQFRTRWFVRSQSTSPRRNAAYRLYSLALWTIVSKSSLSADFNIKLIRLNSWQFILQRNGSSREFQCQDF